MILSIVLIVSVVVLKEKNKSNVNGLPTGDLKVTNFLEADGATLSKEMMKALFSSSGLGKYWAVFEPRLREEISIITRPINETLLPIGRSKIGGLPDLPKGVAWFKEKHGQSLSFLAQINCRDLKGVKADLALPNEGILYFFYSAEQEAWGFDIKDADKFKVFYSKTTDHLERRVAPGDLGNYSVFKACALTFKPSVSLPSWENDFVQNHLTDEEQDRYIAMTGADVSNKLCGYADNIQGEMELECQLVTNGLYCGDPSGYNDPRRSELEKGASDWQLLLQIDSEEEKTGMMWGDVGRIYFWIKKQDLINQDFDKAWFAVQCF